MKCPSIAFLCFMAALLSGIACTKKDDKAGQATFGLTDLAGTWHVSCTPASFGQLGLYRIATLQITADGEFAYTNTHYNDKACTLTMYEESSQGSIQMGEAIDATGRRLTLIEKEGSGIGRQDSMMTYLNELGVCGYKNWVKDQPQNLIGTKCIGWSEANATNGVNLIDGADGKKKLQVFSISGPGTKELTTGDDFIKQ